MDFIQRHGSRVMGVLSGFDRVRFRGTLRWLCYPDGLAKYLSVMGILLKDFKGFVTSVTGRLRDATQALADEAGRPMKFLRSSSISKEDVAREMAERDGLREGLIAVLSATELSRSFDIGWDAERRHLLLQNGWRKCLHYYHYWIHPEWGFMHARLQTWFPFTVHICINGREWLARQMDREGLSYVQRDNCFVRLSDVKHAQRLMDQQLRVNWKRMLNDLVPQFHPIYKDLFPTCPGGYYWSVDESEWATDVMFRSAAKLAVVYPSLIRHGMEHLGSHEVMRFLGRKANTVPQRFTGEVTTDLRRRHEGVRIKHRLNRNSIKMYDKQGSVLRVETTIYDAKDLRVYRPSESNPQGPKSWRIMRKAVADTRRRAQFCQAANGRYLESMATVEDKTVLGDLAATLCRPTRWKGRRVRALNPLSVEDASLLGAVNRGEFTIQGLRNRDLRAVLYGLEPTDRRELRRQSAAVTRKLRLLRAHGLIHKVSKSHRYQVSSSGRKAITALLSARAADIATLTSAA